MTSNNPIKRFKLDRSIVTSLPGERRAPNALDIYLGQVALVDGSTIIIRSGACSDGCSPTKRLGRWVIGPWNGRVVKRLGLPETYRAFFAHDVLLENRAALGLTAEQCHDVFEHEILQTKFPLRKLYVFMVRRYGPSDNKESNEV